MYVCVFVCLTQYDTTVPSRRGGFLEHALWVSARQHCGPAHWEVFSHLSSFWVHGSSSSERRVCACVLFVCVRIQKRGSIIPRQQCKVSLILVQALPSAFIFNSSVETKGPVSAASENQAMGAWPSPAASHTHRVCVSRARADVQTHRNGGVEKKRKRTRESGLARRQHQWQHQGHWAICDDVTGWGSGSSHVIHEEGKHNEEPVPELPDYTQLFFF